MQPETVNGLVFIRVGGGIGQATYANALTLKLQLEGAWVTLQIERTTGDHAQDPHYHTRFPVHILRGQACVGQAFIASYEAPLLTGSSLPELEGLDTAFTQIFQAFVRLHQHQLTRIAWSTYIPNARESQPLLHAADVSMAA